MSLGPGTVVARSHLDAEETAGVKPQHALGETAERVEGISSNRQRRGEGGIEPVEGRLSLLEIVQVHPAACCAVDADDGRGGGPVGLLDALLEEDGAGKLSDDIAARLELVDCRGLEVERVLAGRHRRQQLPVLFRDLHHVIEARVVTIAAFGQAEVGAFAAVAGNDVADDDGATVAGVPYARNVLVLGPEGGIDLGADPIEVSIDGRRELVPANATGPLHGPGVHSGDADLTEETPQLRVAQAAQHRLARPSDLSRWIRGEPYRGEGRRRARLRRGVGMLPELPLARVLPARQLRLVKH